MKALYLSFVLSFVYYSLSAQLSGTSEVSILSPKAASIIKYGEHPVSLHTGLVDISVPVYTIEGHGISVPISFKYHASGLKFDDVSNEVGLGWALIAGGVITHSFRGAQDGLYGTFSRDVSTFKTCDDSSPLDNEYVRLREVENGSRGNFASGSLGRLDGEIDMYSFSFLNHSGSFCFPFLNSEVSGTAPSTGLFIPVSGMKATRSNNQKIEIVDTEGVYYKFEVKDVDQNQSYKEYYLTQIISADKTDTIDFIYEVMSSSSTYIRRPFINYTSSVTNVHLIYTGHGMNNTEDFASESGGIFYQSLRPPRLKRINFRGGYVTFDYAVVNNVPTWDLQQVRIYNNTQSAPLQTVSLTKGSFYNGEKRLDKVTFTNREGQSYDYEFGYFAEPADIDLSPGIDYWGYFNGASVPNRTRYAPIVANAHQLMYQGTDRNANEGQMKKGILNKIIYPTKGYSEFDYEAHQARYSQAQPIQTFGGVRIKEIRNYLSDGSLTEKKWYKYGEMIDTNNDGVPDQESGYGTTGTFLTPNCEDFVSETRTLFTESNDQSYANMHLCKLKVTKTILTFPRINYFQSGSSVVYGRVTEYVGTSLTPGSYINEDYGKTVYTYEVMPDEKLYSMGDTYRLYSVNESQRTFPWKNGNLITKEVYKKEGSTYQRIYRLKNNYMDINAAEFRNVRVRPNVEFEFDLNPYTSTPDIKTNFCGFPQYRQYFGGNGPNLCPYDYFNYYTTTAQRVLTSTEETIDGVTTTTVYDTYNAYGLPTSIFRTNSKGETFNTVLKYPTDYPYTTYTAMVGKNILTPVIEKTISKNGIFIKRESTDYSNFYGWFYAPASYSEQYQNGVSDIEKEYGYNSKGNIEHIRVRGKSKSVYLWGYNNRYPIAHIENATWDQIYGILGGALIDRVAKAETPSSADLAVINNLRTNTNIPDALVTTYAYIPLIGMTSQTDPNGITTYFENDSFGRLKYAKDNEGNILQAYEYRYKQ